jgi:hypothetical protein
VRSEAPPIQDGHVGKSELGTGGVALRDERGSVLVVLLLRDERCSVLVVLLLCHPW